MQLLPLVVVVAVLMHQMVLAEALAVVQEHMGLQMSEVLELLGKEMLAVVVMALVLVLVVVEQGQ
jgi:hypothetical protein